MTELRTTPFYRALYRPHQIFGGDRDLMYFAMFLSVGIALFGMSLLTFVIGILLAVISVFALREMAKVDPLMWQIYVRQLRYKDHYPPCSTSFRVSYSKQDY